MSIQQMLIWLCICPADQNTSQLKRYSHTVFSILVVTILSLASLSGAILCVKFLSIDLEECLFALYHTSATSTLLYMLIAVFFSRKRISATFRSLSEIYNTASKN